MCRGVSVIATMQKQRLKTIALTLMAALALALAAPLPAAVADALPSSIHYQGRIRDKNTGELVTGNVNVQFDIYNKLLSPDDQSTTYSTTVSAANGLFDVEIPIDLAQVDFNAGPYYMRVHVGGEDLGEEPLFGVPYALNADQIDGYDANIVIVEGLLFAYSTLETTHPALAQQILPDLLQSLAFAAGFQVSYEKSFPEETLGGYCINFTCETQRVDMVVHAIVASQMALQALPASELAKTVGSYYGP